MINRTITKYEIIAWRDADNPQGPDYMDRFSTKRTAMAYAKKALERSHFPLLEVNRLEVNQYDENDVWESALIASWTNGKRTA